MNINLADTHACQTCDTTRYAPHDMRQRACGLRLDCIRKRRFKRQRLPRSNLATAYKNWLPNKQTVK